MFVGGMNEHVIVFDKFVKKQSFQDMPNELCSQFIQSAPLNHSVFDFLVMVTLGEIMTVQQSYTRE